MKNKLIYIKAIVFSWAILASSCTADWLNISPSDSASEDIVFSDKKGAEAALSSVYDAIQGRNKAFEYYGARMIYFGDVRSDDMQSTDASKRTASTYLMDYTQSTAPAIWMEPYRAIRRANKFMEALDKYDVAGATQDDLDNYRAQTLVARALVHFDLMRVHSLPYDVATNGENYAIPLLTTVTDVNSQPGRSSINQVYTQVEKDLTDAIPKLSTDATLGYFNSWTAKALLSRIYLYKGTATDDLKAYNLAVDIITNSPYTLWTNAEYAGVWSKQETNEVIFEIINAGSDDWVDKNGLAYLYSEAGYADAIMTKAFVDFAQSTYAGDVRLNLMKEAVSTGSTTSYQGKKVYINKYPGRDGSPQYVNNVPILRLSEMYLIASEAAMKLGDKVNASKYLNDIIKRGNPSATLTTSANVTLDRIIQENRMEFVGEGHRFFDLTRNNKRVVRYTSDADIGWHLSLREESKGFDRSYFRAILPIPESEIVGNSTIAKQQNTGY